MKVVINACFGGFGLSREAFLKLRQMGNQHAKKEPDYGEKYSDGSGPRQQFGRHDSFCSGIDRDDPMLVKVVEELGDVANGDCAKLKIVEIPDGVNWEVSEYDGNEHIAEKHQTWG